MRGKVERGLRDLLLGAAMLLAGRDEASSQMAGARAAISPDAVAAALAKAGLVVAAGQVRLAAAPSANTDAPELQVAAAEQRPEGALRVRVACRTAVQCVPFFVTVDPDRAHAAESAASFEAFAGQRSAGRVPAAVEARDRAAGVAVGAQVRLELADAQMRITVPAVAIDTGAPGSEVRVASLDRKHTWRGRVVDATTVKGGLQ